MKKIILSLFLITNLIAIYGEHKFSHEFLQDGPSCLIDSSLDDAIIKGHLAGFSSDEKRNTYIPLLLAVNALILWTLYNPKKSFNLQDVVTLLGASYAASAIFSYFFSIPINDSAANLISSVFLIKSADVPVFLTLSMSLPFFDLANEIKKNNKINYRYLRAKKPA